MVVSMRSADELKYSLAAERTRSMERSYGMRDEDLEDDALNDDEDDESGFDLVSFSPASRMLAMEPEPRRLSVKI